MHRILWIIGPIVAAAALLLGAVGYTTAAHHASGQSMQFAVQFEDSAPLPIVGPFPTVGDEVVIHDLLFRGSTQVAHSGGVCVLSDATAPEIACTVTFVFAGGQIATQFLTTPPPQKVFAVTGGTGVYRGVRGDGTLVEHGDGTGTITFHLIGAEQDGSAP